MRPCPFSSVLAVGGFLFAASALPRHARASDRSGFLVALERDAVVAALLDDGLDHAAVAVERVGGDDPALQIDEAQHLECGVNLVAVLGRDSITPTSITNPGGSVTSFRRNSRSQNARSSDGGVCSGALAVEGPPDRTAKADVRRPGCDLAFQHEAPKLRRPLHRFGDQNRGLWGNALPSLDVSGAGVDAGVEDLVQRIGEFDKRRRLQAGQVGKAAELDRSQPELRRQSSEQIQWRLQ